MPDHALPNRALPKNEGGVPRLEVTGPVARITLHRPAQHNRLDPADLPILLDHFDALVKREDVQVLVLTGSGSKTFSSGYTLSAIKDELDDRFERVLDTLEALPLPVICALNGSAYGGATDLALCCDFRIGVEGTRMFMPAARFGLHYYPGGIRRYVTTLGLSAAKKLFLTAQAIDAEEMLRINFLTELVKPEDLENTVQRYISALLECAPGVVASMKRDLNQAAAGQSDLPAQRAAYEASLTSAELARRVAGLAKSG